MVPNPLIHNTTPARSRGGATLCTAPIELDVPLLLDATPLATHTQLIANKQLLQLPPLREVAAPRAADSAHHIGLALQRLGGSQRAWDHPIEMLHEHRYARQALSSPYRSPHQPPVAHA